MKELIDSIRWYVDELETLTGDEDDLLDQYRIDANLALIKQRCNEIEDKWNARNV